MIRLQSIFCGASGNSDSGVFPATGLDHVATFVSIRVVEEDLLVRELANYRPSYTQLIQASILAIAFMA